MVTFTFEKFFIILKSPRNIGLPASVWEKLMLMKETFEELLITYEPMLHKIIRSLNIYTNDEDWMQIAKIALWEASTRFDEKKGTFLNYSYTYVKGKLLKELTKRNKLKEDLLETEQIQEGVTEEYDYLLLLDYCLDHLSSKEQIWLKETVINGLSVIEIAKKYEVSPSSVKYWRKLAKEKLVKNVKFL